MRSLSSVACISLLTVAGIGCRGGNVAQQTQLQQYQQQYVTQINDLQRRASSLDSNNVDLHQQLARSEQHVRVLQQDLELVRGELRQAAQQLAAVQSQKATTTERLAMLEASTRQRGGAVITANSSLRREIDSLKITGVEVRHEGGSARITIPTDSLFQSNTANFVQSGYTLLDQVVAAMKTHYPTESITIEGHTDNNPIAGPWGNGDQLSAAQATAVFQILSVRHQMESGRFQILGHGAHQPLASNGTPQGQARNRRIELVIQASK